MDPILTVSNLNKKFGEKIAVDTISFSVESGEVMGLLGPNGAGKTTAIRMIMGILAVDSGQIKFNLNSINSGFIKSAIGYLPEERGLYDDAGVLDNLVYLSGLKGVQKEEAKRAGIKWLERLDLAGYANQKLEKLSKGMQQKVQFIASILHKPRLVLFDEPFSGLDPINQDFIKSIIRELQEDGITVLLSAHQMNLVEELCDNIFLINRGREVLSGSLRNIKKSYKEDLIELHYNPTGDSSNVTAIEGIRVIKSRPGYLSLRYSGPWDKNELLQFFCSKISIEEISVEKPPLHEIFIETVKDRGVDGE